RAIGVTNGTIDGNKIEDILRNGSCYGVIITPEYISPVDQTRRPRPENVMVTNNVVKNVPHWTGLDTHGGRNIQFRGNSVIDCLFGINLGKSDFNGADPLWTAEDCVADGNFIVGLIKSDTANSLYGVANSALDEQPGNRNRITN